MTAKTTVKRKPANKKRPSVKTDIINSYKQYVLLNGRDPNSVFEFMHAMDKNEQEFYNHFSSFNAINKFLWTQYFNETEKALKVDKNYPDYSTREKLLAFYFTFIEALKKDRSYVHYSFDQIEKPQLVPSFLKSFKVHFKDYTTNLIGEGVSNEEIIKRPVIGERYFEGIWLQLLFVINFWLKDDSANFENTDAAIEKAVNLSFELMGKGPLDTMVDFAKFLFNNRK